MERIVTRGQGSGDSHGHIPWTVENSCPSQHSKRIHCNWKSQMVQHQCGVHHVSFMKATERQCISKVNPSELLSQHELNIQYMVNFIKSRSVLFDFKPQNGFFIDNRGKIICEMCQHLLVSCATMLTYPSIPWYILGWQLWEIHVQQNPHARGLHPFRSTSDLKQIYSTWNQFTEDLIRTYSSKEM